MSVGATKTIGEFVIVPEIRSFLQKSNHTLDLAVDNNLHALHKTSLLMLPAEGTDGIHDPIHLPEGHTVHPLVQILKSSLHGILINF